MSEYYEWKAYCAEGLVKGEAPYIPERTAEDLEDLFFEAGVEARRLQPIRRRKTAEKIARAWHEAVTFAARRRLIRQAEDLGIAPMVFEILGGKEGVL